MAGYSYVITVSVLLFLSPVVFCGKSAEKCLEYSKPFENDKIKESKIKGPASTLGKEPTAPGEFPHVAALGFKIDNGKISFLCGGSIISEKFILTTATCAKDEKDITPLKIVRVGDHNLKSSADDGHVQEVEVSRVIPHPEYKPPSVYHDIGLVELARPLQLTQWTRPACLAQSRILPSKPMSAIGWGKVNFGEEAADALHKVYLDVFDHAECQQQYSEVSARKLKHGIDDDLMICAGGKKSSKDTCKGDSGGPLQYFNPEKNNYELVGIISLGKVCGVPGVPSVYTRIQSHIPWIEGIVWK